MNLAATLVLWAGGFRSLSASSRQNYRQWKRTYLLASWLVSTLGVAYEPGLSGLCWESLY
jgi:hypothetical protein